MEHSENNAMAEIALALAMGFFSIMVLTMVSMGGQLIQQKEVSLSSLTEHTFEIARNVENQRKADQNSPLSDVKNVTQDEMIIFYQGRFLDYHLDPIDPNGLPTRQDGYLMALDPELSLSEAARIKEQLKHISPKLVPLTQDWLNALKNKYN